MSQVLIVEDDQYLADAYQNEFQAQGIKVHLAQDGIEAQKILSSLKPDLLVVDLIMPHQGGMELIRSLRSQPEFANLPIIVGSNVDNQETRTEAISLGVKEYLVKSDTSLEDFVRRCQSYLPLPST